MRAVPPLVPVIVVLLPHAVFGLVVRDGVVALAPPISKRSLGRSAREVWDFYARRGRVLWMP